MANYLFAYHGGGVPETPEEQAETMAAWGAWYGELGEAIVDGGAPTMPTTTVTADGSTSPSSNPVTGYSIVAADSLEDALAKASGCPIRAGGGSIEVGELIDMTE